MKIRIADWCAAVVLFGFSLCTGVAAGAPRTDLNQNWQFRADPDATGESLAWSRVMPADTERVAVPHTWNIGRLHDYLGVAWYFREFDGPAPAAGGHVQLHFGATFYSARVWLNGVELGTHEGGFTAYSFDITAHLHARNLLVVRLDNRPGIATIPGFAERGSPQARYDWWTYGGIVRDVWLTSSGPVWVRRQEIRSEVQADTGVVLDHILIGGASQNAPIAVQATVFDSDNRVQATARRSIERGSQDVSLSLQLPHAKRWSLDHPSLYWLRVQLVDGQGKILDDNSSSFGLRRFEISDRHLLLNGERVRLTGLARHEDSPWEGLAETRGTILHDFDDMKSLHTTLSRPVHYPQSPVILDYADRHGIVLIPEIPVWQFSEAQLSDPKVIALAKRQMREMIEEAGNHPSIFGWSVANESAMGTPGGIAYFRALRDMIHQIDPGRPVTFADDNLPKLDRGEQSAAADADFILMNQYFGSWHGPAEALGPALDKVERLFPAKMVIISEMGFAGIFAKDAIAADQARVATIQTQMPMLAARDWIGGAILWCYQDYKSPRNLWPGETEGFVDHGVVDAARQRRPSYHTWELANRPASIRAHWAPASRATPGSVAITVTPNTEVNLPFYPLHDYRVVWKVLDAAGKIVGGGDQPLDASQATQTIDATIAQAASSQALNLTVSLIDAAGATALQDSWRWPEP